MYRLLKKYREGDEKAIEKIIEAFVPLILKESSRYRVKCYDYEDLVQHGYLSVMKAANMYKGSGESFKFYCIKAIKQNYKALLKGEIKHYREIPEEKDDRFPYKFTVEDEVIAYEKTKDIYKAIDTLTEREKNILNGFYIEKKTIKDIAKENGRSYNKTRYEKIRIVEKLKKQLEIREAIGS